MKRYIPILCIFILCFHYLKASEGNEEKSTIHEWKIGGSFQKGRTIKHSEQLGPILERSSMGGEIFLSKQTYGLHRWNTFFNYPEYGLCYKYLDLGSPTYVGTAQCLFPYLNFHLLSNRSPFNFFLRTGAGFAHVEKTYNAVSDTLNHAFSTHLNVVLNAQLQAVCRISKTFSLYAGAEITHLSNGAYQMPNLGTNTFSYFAGISQSFGGKKQLEVIGDKTNKRNKPWDCSVYFLGGIKEINPIGGKKYFAGDLDIELTKKHLQYTRFGISLDVTHDASEYDCIIFQSLPAVDRFSTTRIGVSGGYVWLFGNFSLDLYLGAYIHEENLLYGKIYQRTSLRYPLSDRLKLSIMFRNHKGKADYIGIGFGYRISR